MLRKQARVIPGTTFWHYIFLSLGTWTASIAKDCNFSRRCEKTLSNDYTAAAAAAAVLSLCLHVWRSWFSRCQSPTHNHCRCMGKSLQIEWQGYNAIRM